MKKLLLFLTFLFPSLVHAADMPLKAAPAPLASVYAPWSGIYGGLSVGYGWDWSGTDLSVAGTTLATLGNSPHGLTGGARLGYDTQTGPFVLGLVTDVNLASFTSNSNTNMAVSGAGGFGGLLGSVQNSTNWWGTTDIRLGFPQFGNHVLPYLVGGAAYGGKTTSVNGAIVAGTTSTNAASTTSASASTTSLGWNAGLGIETKITPQASIFIEAKYIDLGSLNNPLGNVTNGPVMSSQAFKFGVAQGGFNYHF